MVKNIDLLKKMKLIRFIEEGIADRYSSEKMRCPTHLSIGQEAAAVGVCSALKNSDLAVSSHRAHAHYLAKGGSPKSMIAEIYGKEAGCCGGKGGSMHLIDLKAGFVGSTAIVGNSIPLGVGLGLSLKLKNQDNVAVTFFGDGSTEEGSFYESVNFAIVKELPVLFICENNFYSVYSPLSVRQPSNRKIFKMTEGLGINSTIVDGNDVEASYKATSEAVKTIKKTNQPYFIELTTYRWREHCGPSFDNNIGYRTENEFNEWKKKDPISTYEKKLIKNGDLSISDISQIDKKILEEVNNYFDFAINAPFPNEENAYKNLFAE